MRAVLAVVGKDKTGIISTISTFLAERNVNILDISQTILQDYFAMIMLVDVSKSTIALAGLSEECSVLGNQIGMSVHVQHEEIFNAMHNV